MPCAFKRLQAAVRCVINGDIENQNKTTKKQEDSVHDRSKR